MLVAYMTALQKQHARLANRIASQQTIYSSDCCYLPSLAVFQILGSKRIGVTSLTFQGQSRDVVGHVAIRFPIGYCLLVVLWNQAFISNSFRDSLFNGECNAMVDMRPLNKGQGH